MNGYFLKKNLSLIVIILKVIRNNMLCYIQHEPVPENMYVLTIFWGAMLVRKILLQHYINQELSDIQAGFRKGRGTRDQIANILWITEKARSSRKTSTSALMTTPKPLTVWITTNCGKFLKRLEYQTTLPASWEICMHVKKQQLELDMEQQTGSKSGKEYIKAMLSPCSFNLHAEYLMRNARLDESQTRIKIAGININNLR